MIYKIVWEGGIVIFCCLPGLPSNFVDFLGGAVITFTLRAPREIDMEICLFISLDRFLECAVPGVC